MKKYLFVIGFFSVALTSAAQLKVQSDGKTYIQRTTTDGRGILNVGEGTVYDDIMEECGIFVHKRGSQNNKDCIGVYGQAKHGIGYNTIGIYGTADSASNNCNYGVVGALPIGTKGAGIAGTTEGGAPPPYYTNCEFAGLFYGETYIDGYLTGTDGFFSLSDMRLKENVVSLGKDSDSESSALDNLQQLGVIKYDLRRPWVEKAIADGTVSKASLERLAKNKRSHYGLSAQELQKFYPELVREGQDGYLTVNYVELVPILIQSIQELKAELDEVKGSGSGTVMKARQHGAFDDEQTSGVGLQVSSSGNVLFQNTPNPFTERTEIRFTLSDDARNAYIYIFDMTGKTLKQIPVDASMQSVTIGGNELSLGIYLYSLVVNGQEIDTKRMILSK